MRPGIVFLIPSTLVPALGASEQQRHLPSPHGNIALYQGVSGQCPSYPERFTVNHTKDHDPKFGLILGLKPDRAGNVNLAAISPNRRPRHVDIHHDKIVKAHPTDIAGTHIWKPQVASEILRSHERNPPAVTYVTRPAPGSPTYRAAQSLVHIKNGGHPGVGYHEMGGRRRR